jgi:phage shock protein PspC (stress-responsive transcriptional regulator)
MPRKSKLTCHIQLLFLIVFTWFLVTLFHIVLYCIATSFMTYYELPGCHIGRGP